MRKFLTAMAFLGAVLVPVLCAAPASAQATRTWVSGVGDDANPCSRTAPCKTFAGAISKTAAGGEINCLDPGGFGAVTITKSISILCSNTEAGVLVSSGNGINITSTPSNAKIVLEGLDFEGLSTASYGVRMTGGGKLTIRNCNIRNFAQTGVSIESAAGSPVPRILIQNTIITGNTVGFNVSGASGAANNGEVLNSVIDGNLTGIQVAAGGIVILSGSVITGNPTAALSFSGGGQIISYGNNTIRNPGVPTSTTPLQ